MYRNNFEDKFVLFHWYLDLVLQCELQQPIIRKFLLGIWTDSLRRYCSLQSADNTEMTSLRLYYSILMYIHNQVFQLDLTIEPPVSDLLVPVITGRRTG